MFLKKFEFVATFNKPVLIQWLQNKVRLLRNTQPKIRDCNLDN